MRSGPLPTVHVICPLNSIIACGLQRDHLRVGAIRQHGIYRYGALPDSKQQTFSVLLMFLMYIYHVQAR